MALPPKGNITFLNSATNIEHMLKHINLWDLLHVQTTTSHKVYREEEAQNIYKLRRTQELTSQVIEKRYILEYFLINT